MRNIILVTAISALALTACKKVEDAPAGVSGEVAEDSAAAALNAPQRAYAEANTRMHAGMGIIDKDADIAFIQGMIPHHQGAVDMANIILEHGDDEEAKELARNIIKAQEEEIAWMKNWLKERGLKEIDVEGELAKGVDHEAMGHSH